eukprot:SAG11_NODE_11090_length_784_cov_1.335766_2_plen_130_part_00
MLLHWTLQVLLTVAFIDCRVAANERSGVRSVSKLVAALSGQDFRLSVAAGGAAVLTSRTSGEHLSTVSSVFSEPGPKWHSFGPQPNTSNWATAVHRLGAGRAGWSQPPRRTSPSAGPMHSIRQIIQGEF